jgi:hypothetical protein
LTQQRPEAGSTVKAAQRPPARGAAAWFPAEAGRMRRRLRGLKPEWPPQRHTSGIAHRGAAGCRPLLRRAPFFTRERTRGWRGSCYPDAERQQYTDAAYRRVSPYRRSGTTSREVLSRNVARALLISSSSTNGFATICASLIGGANLRDAVRTFATLLQALYGGRRLKT